MNNTKDTNVMEDVDVNIESKTLRFPVRVKMSSASAETLDCGFLMSLDDNGMIVLTPKSNDCEFIDATTEWESDDYVTDTDTHITEIDGTFVKEFTVTITANLLKEIASDKINADIDSIGQCVIYPEEGNSFVSAAQENSLNLVTEDSDAPTEEGTDESTEKDSDTKVVPDLEGKLVEEADPEYSFEEVFDELKQITNNFKEASGTVECVYESEMKAGVKILEAHYTQVDVEKINDWYHISYSMTPQLTEEFNTQDVVARFMQGEIGIFEDTKVPANSIRLSELDSHGFEGYYEPESDSVVFVPDQEM